MLLFICINPEEPNGYYKFQYISCYSLSIIGCFRTIRQNCFNTSHVTLYLMHTYDAIAHMLFQYISCYSLSDFMASVYPYNSGFNTSHVTLYLLHFRLVQISDHSFNTSHVTLYRFNRIWFDDEGQFQYISCYSLSVSRLAAALDSRSFNTSHVTLYRYAAISLSYLPCKFQYISCYSLSSAWERIGDAVGSFNTSHVTLYRSRCNLYYVGYKFQYISCYSLSDSSGTGGITSGWFQYISCYSLSKIKRVPEPVLCVSIHLMLLFIRVMKKVCYRLNRFNTSHVTLYPVCFISNVAAALFQYISCYSLSSFHQFFRQLIPWFQYISCYSLSVQYYLLSSRIRCFNTSHVTLYPSFYRLFFF